MSNNDNKNLPNLTFDFSKFMKDTLQKEESKKQFDTKSFNPNKEYVKRYYESSTGRMWILDPNGSKQPRYR